MGTLWAGFYSESLSEGSLGQVHRMWECRSRFPEEKDVGGGVKRLGLEQCANTKIGVAVIGTVQSDEDEERKL